MWDVGAACVCVCVCTQELTLCVPCLSVRGLGLVGIADAERPFALIHVFPDYRVLLIYHDAGTQCLYLLWWYCLRKRVLARLWRDSLARVGRDSRARLGRDSID